jgi:hypothetical protein
MKKSNSLLIGYARVSKADAQDTAVQVKALPGRLQTDFRRELLWWSLGSTRTSEGLGALEGRGRACGLETRPAFAIPERSSAYHGTRP